MLLQAYFAFVLQFIGFYYVVLLKNDHFNADHRITQLIQRQQYIFKLNHF